MEAAVNRHHVSIRASTGMSASPELLLVLRHPTFFSYLENMKQKTTAFLVRGQLARHAYDERCFFHYKIDLSFLKNNGHQQESELKQHPAGLDPSTLCSVGGRARKEHNISFKNPSLALAQPLGKDQGKMFPGPWSVCVHVHP